jgi:hypothetical protein
MRLIVAISFLAISLSSFAQQLDLFPNATHELKLKELMDAGCENTHNGDCDLKRFDPKTFDYKKILDKIARSYRDSDRSYQYELELKWKYILGNVYVKEARVDKALKYFLDQKLVLALIGAAPDESCDESEYCSLYDLYIYLKTGDLVIFNFDFTT